MSNEHPITPPPELVESLRNSAPAGVTRELHLTTAAYLAGAEQQLKLDTERINKARQDGADQELERCLNQLRRWGVHGVETLRNIRRPEPPSLKEQALALVSHDFSDQPCLSEEGYAIIRRALEQLPDTH